jgi:hypothetical protein
LFTLSSYAVLEGLFAVQVGLLVGFLLAASILALKYHRLGLAGALFAFTLIKPQVSALLAAYFLIWSFGRWRERRAFVYWFAAWSSILCGLSLLASPHWISRWLLILSGYGGYAPPPLITYSLGPRLAFLGPFLIFILLLASLVLMFRMRDADATSPEFMLTLSLLLALTSITLLPGQAVYDHVILLPGILLTMNTWKRFAASGAFRIILYAASVALFWQWIAVIPLLIWRMLPPSRLLSNRTLLLPFHAAASVPLAVTAVLGFMLWKEMKLETVPRS